MTRYLTVELTLRIARAAIGGPAAALLHSLARNRALIDGNERLAWLAT